MNQIAIRTDQQPKLMLLAYMADRYSLSEVEFSKTVRATCGLEKATPEQFAAFLIVAKEYNLNPLTKEIYAFPGRGGGIVPIVSIDGWVNLVNSHGACDGFEFEMEHSDGKLVSCTCRMYRKDRKHPVTVTEYLSECIRATDPWKMQHRMLRHKSMIQAARYAFGFSGVYDEDEGRVIADAVDVTPRPRVPSPSDVAQIEHAANGPEKPAGEASDDVTDNLPNMQASPSEPRVVPLTPHLIVGGDYTAKTWSEAYIAAMQTSPDTATVFKWVDANATQLKRLTKAMFAKVEAATKEHQDKLRVPVAMPDIATDYEAWIKWAVAKASATDAGDDMEELFESFDPFWSDIFPADKETLLNTRRGREATQEP